jgi:hypothetical protein
MRRIILSSLTVASLLALVPTRALQASGEAAGEAEKPATVEVLLCDGESTIEIAAEEQPTRESGERAAAQLMAKWAEKNPDANWEVEERKSRTFIPPADNSHLLEADTQAEGHPYRSYSKLDLLTWQRETERYVAAGSRVFHDANELGSTIAVSCDMCHPNAANTHPETYPKFQTQLGQVALLRDMINWCLEHPVRAPRMAEDDPRMRAMEAYITSQRSGTPIEYGKH